MEVVSALTSSYHRAFIDEAWLEKVADVLRDELDMLPQHKWDGVPARLLTIWPDSRYEEAEHEAITESFLIAVGLRGKTTDKDRLCFLGEVVFRADHESFPPDHPVVRMFRVESGALARGALSDATALEVYEHLVTVHGSSEADAISRFGFSDLWQAIELEYIELLELLLNKHPRMHELTDAALESAVIRGKIQSARYLLTRVDPNLPEKANSHRSGRPLLCCALASNDRPMAELLLEHDAAVRARDHANNTALHYAARFCPRALPSLCSAGADIEAVNDAGLLAIDYAEPESLSTMRALGSPPPAQDWASPSDIELTRMRYETRPFSDEDEDSDAEALDQLARMMTRLSEDEAHRVFQRWMGDEVSDRTNYVATRVFGAMKRPPESLSLWVLEKGVLFPNPSANRAYVEPAVEHLGLHRALIYYIGLLESGRQHRRGVPRALYWTRGAHSPSTRALRQRLLRLMMEQFLAEDDLGVLQPFIAAISLASERPQEEKRDRELMAACKQRALAHGDPYLKNRAEMMEPRTPGRHLLMALPRDPSDRQ